MSETTPRGTLALIGGSEWTPSAAPLDAWLVARAGAGATVVVTTAAAFAGPERVGAAARAALEPLGTTVTVLDALHRADGSPLHLRSVLKDSALFRAIRHAHREGAVIAASGAGATLLGDPMVDPRGGAYTVGLGIVTGLAVLPHHAVAPRHLLDRSLELLPARSTLAGVDDGTALVREADGTWQVVGAGAVTLYTHTEGRVATRIGTYPADSAIDTLTM
jgi:cyanophycinase